MITIQLLLPIPEDKLRLLLNEWGVKINPNHSKMEVIEEILVNAPAKRDEKRYRDILELANKYKGVK